MTERMKNIGLATVMLGTCGVAVYGGYRALIDFPQRRDAIMEKIPACWSFSSLRYNYLQQEVGRELDLRERDNRLGYMGALVEHARSAQFVTCGVEAEKAVKQANLGPENWRVRANGSGLTGGALGSLLSGWFLLRRLKI